METKIVRIPEGSLADFEKELCEAAEIIKRGGLVAFPTETVYGLGANALDCRAAEKIYEAKGRPSDNPLIIHIASKDDYGKYCNIENEALLGKIVDAFVPGPITVIQKKKSVIPDTVTAGMDTVAVRFPSHPVARRLIELSGVPIAAPSANTSGRPSPTKAEHVIEDLMGKVDMIIDGGDCEVGLESTIVMLDGDGIKMLRPGGVTLSDLERISDNVTLDRAIKEKLSANEKPLAPGMKYRHYAPKVPVVLLQGEDGKVRERLFTEYKKGRAGIIAYAEDGFEKGTLVRVLGSKDDKPEMARTLFDSLRYFDGVEGIDVIYSRLPDEKDIGLAIVNRLIKASGYTVIEVK